MKKRLSIGMLIGWKVEPELCLASAMAASSQQADFFYFYPGDVKEATRTIRGKEWNGTKWVYNTFDYPDVVYDRMRRRGSDQFGNIYEKLAGIPMTHTLIGKSMYKTKVYNLLLDDPELQQIVIPFITMREPEQVIAFIHQHQPVVLKADRGAKGENTFTAEFKGDLLEVFDQTYIHQMDTEQTMALVKLLIERRYCAQKLVQSSTAIQDFPFYIRVHIAKNGKNEWIVAFCSAGISLKSNMKIVNSKKTLMVSTTWNRFLEHQFGEEVNGPMDQKIQNTALQLARYLEKKIGSGFHEIGLDIGIDEDRNIWLFEAGIGLPSTLFHYTELARPAIEYSLYLARQSLK
ncbi:YheC/YheD family protein [Paenibacillus nicotianae]|uniref:YheC/YheD family protein n=1 Tax=Paenibacillus nicotianae TaxID=1526551 RepID=A0ABW4UPC5_9BACL